ncbi:MAG: autotransporter domain-containing protein, partial [Chlamydiales bacterium]|nr:autotransporter domain-containing protein [Chlamydiales bacterium]
FLMKNGLGTQTISGTVDPINPSTINAGILNLTGSFTGDITINPPGTLTGSAIIAGSVFNDGLVIPVNTLTLDDFTNSSTGIYNVQVSASEGNYLVDATSSATLNGEVLVTSFNGTYAFNETYTILQSASISGTFSSASGPTALITPTLSYDATHVYLKLKQNVAAAAFTSNERAVANVLDAAAAPTLAQSLLLSQIVGFSLSDAQRAIDSISGEPYANQTFFSEATNRQFIRRLYDPIRQMVTCNECPDTCCRDFTTWFEAGGNFSYIDENSSKGYQFTWGFQKGFCPSWIIGLAASYEGDFLNYKENGGSAYSNNALVGLYTLYRPDRFYFLADIAYGYNLQSMTRNIHLGSDTSHARSTPKNSEATFYSEIGPDLFVNRISIQPFLGVEVDAYWRDKITETSSSGWQLIVQERSKVAAYSRLGLHLTGCKPESNFLISLDAAWDCRLTSADNSIYEKFVSFDGNFEIEGESLSRNSFDYGFTIENRISESWNFYLETTGQIYSNATTFTALTGFTFSW